MSFPEFKERTNSEVEAGMARSPGKTVNIKGVTQKMGKTVQDDAASTATKKSIVGTVKEYTEKMAGEE